MEKLLGLGLEPKDLGVLQVCLRGVVVFLASLIIVRLGHKRFLSRMTAFDAVLGFMMASVLSRAINGSAPLGSTLAVGLVLVMLHRAISALAYHSHFIGRLVKGQEETLIENGRWDEAKLRRHKVSESDLREEARLNGQITELGKIRVATLERNGKISVIPADE